MPRKHFQIVHCHRNQLLIMSTKEVCQGTKTRATKDAGNQDTEDVEEGEEWEQCFHPNRQRLRVLTNSPSGIATKAFAILVNF